MPAILAVFNGPSCMILIGIVWILIIKILVLWWIISAMIKYRTFRYIVLGLLAFVLLGLAFMVISVLLPSRVTSRAPAAAATAAPTSGQTEPATSAGREEAAMLTVRLQSDADLWLEGTKAQQTGGVRLFRIPGLEPGVEYDYKLRASWAEGGQAFDETRRIKVHAGEKAEVDFTRPDPSATR